MLGAGGGACQQHVFFFWGGEREFFVCFVFSCLVSASSTTAGCHARIDGSLFLVYSVSAGSVASPWDGGGGVGGVGGGDKCWWW